MEEKNTYGTNKSWLLGKVKEAGFNPIAITVMICEETFVFETSEEASKGFEWVKNNYGNEGWWYGKADFEKARQDYVNDYKKHGWGEAPKVYWLNEQGV